MSLEALKFLPKRLGFLNGQESNWHLSKSYIVSFYDSEVKMTSAEVISEMRQGNSTIC